MKKLSEHENIEVKFKEYPDTFTVELYNMWDKKPDCKVGHFGYNFYFRTPYGMKCKEYKNIKTMWNSIKKVARRNGLVAESIGIKHCYRYRAVLT